jgi:hypothetical protein
MIQIIWPEKRFVTEETIEGWFADAVADNEVSPDDISAKTPMDKARVLEDIGKITVGTESFGDSFQSFDRCRCPRCGMPTITDGTGLTETDMLCDRCYTAIFGQ